MSRSAAIELSQYAAMRAVSGLFHVFPACANIRTADGIGDVFARLGPRRVQRAIDNLRASFPEWTDERVRDCAHASIRNMFRLFAVDSMVMPRLITPSSWPRHVEIGSIGAGLDLLLAQRPAIFLTGHFGNWELLGFVMATIGFPFAAVARPLDNRWLNRWLLGVREARGMRILTKWGVTRQLQTMLEARHEAAAARIAFIADQNAGDDGLFVPFFGRLASCYKSIGLLAMRYRTPVACGAALRIGDDFRFRLEVIDLIEPDEWDAQADPLFYITARYARALETMVRTAPEQYLWIHRRWKSRPRFERDGNDLPAALRRKLEALPWMTQDDLDRIRRASAAAARRTA